VNTAGTIVTIPLNEPLLKGLEWDVYYPEGAFTDLAGNPAVASNETTYWFTTPGVQAPVVRVNRRSYDGRNGAWSSTTGAGNTFADPANNGTWNASTTNFAVGGVAGDLGWNMASFNTVHYRVESESPGAAITAQTFQGTAANKGAVTAAWGNNVEDSNTGATVVTAGRAWAQAASNTNGEWVLSNLIRRSRNGTDQSYSVYTKNGTTESRTSTGTLRMYRSYNRDLSSANLGYLTAAAPTDTLATATLTNGQGILSFVDMQASKSYVVGTASKNDQDAKGVEGVFRTVIVFNYANDNQTGNNFILVEGSNIKNGMPSIAGFPVQDAQEAGDRRYVKAFFNDTRDGATARTRYYWVSTEIVCEWYFLCWGGNGTHMNVGEANNYMMVGYGDLTYGYAITRY